MSLLKTFAVLFPNPNSEPETVAHGKSWTNSRDRHWRDQHQGRGVWVPRTL